MQESAAHEVEHALIDQAVIKVPPETVYVKYDTTKESIKTNDCVHYFLNCGYGVQVCDYCTAFKMI
jgi:hypothetical protein